MHNPDSPNITVSEHLITFSQALRPCLEKVEHTLHAMSEPYFAGVDGMDGPEGILERAGMACGNLNNLVNAMMTEIITDPDVTVETTYRHVGRFEGNLDMLLDACERASYINFHGYPEAKRLLVGGLSNILEQIRDWLKDICDTIDHPLQAYQSKPHGMEDGSAVFSFDLVLKAPLELEQLGQLAQNAARSAQAGGGFWNSIGSLILGFAVADWLFDDD